MHKISVIVAICAAGMLCGCAQPQQVASEPLCLPGTTVEQVMETARGVLLDMHFDIDKFDIDERFIQTWPLPGAQIFQVWRRDSATAYSMLENNLHSIRRTVQLEFVPEIGGVCVAGVVHVQRLSVPEQPIRGFGQMAEAFTDSTRRQQSLQMEPMRVRELEWIDLGPDTELQENILHRLQLLIQRDLSL